MKMLLLIPFLLITGTAFAQVPVDENGNPIAATDQGAYGDKPLPEFGTTLTSPELEELVGPVALYPDDLLAIVLPASTYPLEIVQAARFLEDYEKDNSLKPDEDWDESVVALLNYPDVLRMMDDDIDWAWRLGDAVINQQNEVIAAVESFRDRAYAAGNLKSDERQTVSYDDGTIEIEPVDEEIIYVPYYEPEEVVVYQPRRVYYYYPDPYPVYYYPYPVGYRFTRGYFWGVTTAFTIGWTNHYLHVYHPSYWGHPYYGRYYYGHYYRRPSITIYNNWYVNNSYRTSQYRYRDGDYWRPRYSPGSRPEHKSVRNYYYPPGSSRTETRVTNNTRVQVRNDGRMDLNLRERTQTNRTVSTNRNTTSISNRERAEASPTTSRRPTTTVNTNRSGSNRTITNPQPTRQPSPRVERESQSRIGGSVTRPSTDRSTASRPTQQRATPAPRPETPRATAPPAQSRSAPVQRENSRASSRGSSRAEPSRRSDSSVRRERN